jgi:hypothetical protein
MNDRYASYGAASGIAFVVLLLVVLIFFPAPPDFDASPTEVADYYVDDRDAIQVANIILAAALFFFIWFLGSVRSALRVAEGGTGRLSAVAFGGGLVGAAGILVTLAFSAAAGFRPEETSEEITRTLHDISFAFAFFGGVPGFLAFFLAAAAVVLRSGALPAGLGWLALLTALFQAVSLGTIFEDSGAFSADGFFGYAPVVLVLAWVLVASITLVREPLPAPAATAPSGPPPPGPGTT